MKHFFEVLFLLLKQKNMAIRIKRKYQGRQREINTDVINWHIRQKELLVITDSGEKLELSKDEALKMAEQAGLDLILITDKGGKAVAKIADYGKYRYEKKKKAQAAKKNQKVVELKEVRLTPRIGDHDLDVKQKQARKALLAGNKVKISMRFRYLEKNNDQEPGMRAINKLIEDLKDVSEVSKAPKWRNLFLDAYLEPKK